MSSNRLAVDVGGTFTDVVSLDDRGEIRFEKVPTTPDDPSLGVIDSIAQVDAALDRTSLFTHGTTLALNALLTRSGARTAVVATAGFRDVYLLGRTSREGNYDILYRTPPRLVERCDTFEVTERLMFDGSVHTEFDEADARRIAALVRDGGYESVAVAFLHSYTNPAHEAAMREVLAEVIPDWRCRSRRIYHASTGSTSGPARQSSTHTSNRSCGPTCTTWAQNWRQVVSRVGS